MTSSYTRPLFVSIVLSLLLTVGTRSFAQFSVTGSTCVEPGIAYLYSIPSQSASGHSVTWCVNGGEILHVSTSCQTQTSLSQIMIVWDGGSGMDVTVQVNSVGSAWLAVAQPAALQSGSISNPYQTVYKQAPSTINCSAATGSCSPIRIRGN